MEQKFDIGDEVFVMDQNKISRKTVTGICKVTVEDVPVFFYSFKISTLPEKFSWIREEEIFATKNELIAGIDEEQS